MIHPPALSLKVLAAYARDAGRRIVRIDHQSMDSLGVSAGDTIEIIGKKDGMDVKCYPLLPSDEGQSITRIDPGVRKVIGIAIDDTVMLRKTSSVPAENFELSEADNAEAPKEAAAAIPEMMTDDELGGATSAVFMLSGSCIEFEKERPKLMEYITTLESAVRSKSKCKC